MLYVGKINMLNFPVLLNLGIGQVCSSAHCDRNAAG